MQLAVQTPCVLLIPIPPGRGVSLGENNSQNPCRSRERFVKEQVEENLFTPYWRYQHAKDFNDRHREIIPLPPARDCSTSLTRKIWRNCSIGVSGSCTSRGGCWGLRSSRQYWFTMWPSKPRTNCESALPLGISSTSILSRRDKCALTKRRWGAHHISAAVASVGSINTQPEWLPTIGKYAPVLAGRFATASSIQDICKFLDPVTVAELLRVNAVVMTEAFCDRYLASL